jgi:hypothetical protein
MKFIPSNKSNTREFIEKAKKVHGDKFDYSKVNYVDNRTKICIICPEHGEFWQRPINHLNSEYGCLKCSKKRPNTGIKLNQDDFIKRAKEKRRRAPQGAPGPRFRANSVSSLPLVACSFAQLRFGVCV